MTKAYFAPMEGITTYIYRRMHARVFGGCDAYFSPFIVPSETERVTLRRMRDLLPENNRNIPLRAQVLTDNAEAFCAFGEKVQALGFTELNLNIGCPAATVVAKGRGAAQLRDPEALDRLLDAIFEKTTVQVSVKTRAGFAESAELEQLLPVFNRYPLSLLILHPRTRAQFFGGAPDMDAFATAHAETKNPICYNGDIRSPVEFVRIAERFPRLSGVMIGRGAVVNPAIFREIRGGARLRTEELVRFTSLLAGEYRTAHLSEAHILQKLKEIWTYCIENYPRERKTAKEIKKAGSVAALITATECLPELPGR